MNTWETIQNRRSIRDYEKRELSEEDRRKIEKVFKDIVPLEEGKKLPWEILPKGRMGSCRIGALTSQSAHELIETGYQGQQIVLHLTGLGFGTLWVGVSPKPGMPVHIVCGYPSQAGLKSKLFSVLTSGGAKKPMKSLVEGGEEKIPASLRQVLEAARNSPSAMNKQPWQFRVIGETSFVIHCPKPIEMGIALSHAILYAKDAFEEVSWKLEGPQACQVSLGKPKRTD